MGGRGRWVVGCAGGLKGGGVWRRVIGCCVGLKGEGVVARVRVLRGAKR